MFQRDKFVCQCTDFEDAREKDSDKRHHKHHKNHGPSSSKGPQGPRNASDNRCNYTKSI
jgi:hypothetical protein